MRPSTMIGSESFRAGVRARVATQVIRIGGRVGDDRRLAGARDAAVDPFLYGLLVGQEVVVGGERAGGGNDAQRVVWVEALNDGQEEAEGAVQLVDGGVSDGSGLVDGRELGSQAGGDSEPLVRARVLARCLGCPALVGVHG